jgi:isopenicillin-N epimerase
MPNSLRQHFLLDPNIVFLNHGSFGACPQPVFEEYQHWQLELERQPVEFIGRRFASLMRTAREKLAAYVGTHADNLVYVPNATHALNIVARSLQLNVGDEVLTTNHEYGAMERMWRFLCEKWDARYVVQPVGLPLITPEAFVEQFWSGVTARTRVIFLSHITSPTALIFPIEEICRRARAAGILTIVDGAHTVGQLPLNLDALGADVYTSNCHKWLCAPKGSAFLYVSPHAQPRIEPLVVSWGWQAEAPTHSRFIDEQEYTGTRDIAAYLATPTAIEFFTQHNWEQVRAECHALTVEAQARVLALSGAQPFSPPEYFAQLVSVRLPPCDLATLKMRLYVEYQVEVPLLRWNDEYLIRISVQGYNTETDIDRLIIGLQALLPQTAL